MLWQENPKGSEISFYSSEVTQNDPKIPSAETANAQFPRVSGATHTLSGGRWYCVLAALASPLCACGRFCSSHSSSRANSALITSSSSSCGFFKSKANKTAMNMTLIGWLTRTSCAMDTNMEMSHSSCCLLSKLIPYKSVKNPATIAVERQKNQPMYTNHQGNRHFNFNFFFFFFLGVSGGTNAVVVFTESLLPMDPGQTFKRMKNKIQCNYSRIVVGRTSILKRLFFFLFDLDMYALMIGITYQISQSNMKAFNTGYE